MITHETEFYLGEIVKISGVETFGKIRQICLLPGRTKYEVSYWYDGKYREDWLPEDELQQVRTGG